MRSPDDVRALVQVEGTRVVDLLRSLGTARLSRPGTDAPSPADQAHQVGQALADRAADGAGRVRRPLPRLADHAAGDQLAVLVVDVLAEADPADLELALVDLLALRRSL